MTTLTAPEVATFRSLKKTAIVWLVMLRLDRLVGPQELANLLDMDIATVRRHLSSLSSAGLIARTDYRNGYTVAAGGRQLLLPGIWSNRATTAEDAGASDELLVDGALVQNTQVARPIVPQLAPPLAQNSAPLAQNSDSLGKFSQVEQSLSLKLKSNTLESNDKYLDSDSDLDLQVILKAAQRIFGEPVVCPKSADPGLVLGAIAEAYDRRERLRKPARVACANIRRNQVNACYLEQPEIYLPDDFLVEIGRFDPAPQYLPPELPPAGAPAEPPQRPCSPAANQPAFGDLTPAQAWQSVQAQMRDEMPKPAFERHVQPTWCSDYQPGRIQISASSAESCSWLTSRLTSTAARMLAGIANREIKIVFVAPEYVCAQTQE
jgi:hypothetical protein